MHTMLGICPYPVSPCSAARIHYLDSGGGCERGWKSALYWGSNTGVGSGSYQAVPDIRHNLRLRTGGSRSIWYTVVHKGSGRCPVRPDSKECDSGNLGRGWMECPGGLLTRRACMGLAGFQMVSSKAWRGDHPGRRGLCGSIRGMLCSVLWAQHCLLGGSSGELSRSNRTWHILLYVDYQGCPARLINSNICGAGVTMNTI